MCGDMKTKHVDLQLESTASRGVKAADIWYINCQQRILNRHVVQGPRWNFDVVGAECWWIFSISLIFFSYST